MTKINDPATLERVEKLRLLMNDYIRNQSAPHRDRILQVHLAQARGPGRNLRLLCETTAMLLRARQKMRKTEEPSGEKRDL